MFNFSAFFNFSGNPNFGFLAIRSLAFRCSWILSILAYPVGCSIPGRFGLPIASHSEKPRYFKMRPFFSARTEAQSTSYLRIWTTF